MMSSAFPAGIPEEFHSVLHNSNWRSSKIVNTIRALEYNISNRNIQTAVEFFKNFFKNSGR